MLLERDIKTKEVLGWKGLHLFHFSESTCSQKTRIFLRLKGLSWESHHINLAKKEQLKPFFMGINPRGLVPVLIHDGKVIIESNDILQYLEASFPNPPLIPSRDSERVSELLKAEDDLHLDIRALTMRFVFPSFLAKRSEKDIASYESSGSGSVQGVEDPQRKREAKFWRDMNTHGGITNAQTKRAYEQFKAALNQFETKLAHHTHLAGEDMSLVDIAWYIYCRRLLDAGYALTTHHPRVSSWFDRLHAIPHFREEVPGGGLLGVVTLLLHAVQKMKGETLEQVSA
ncbi:MAG: glutathione S-transferase family protein [Pseudomonadota bacterium]